MAVNIAGLEQAEATKYMISVMQQFKLSAKDTTKVLDSWNNIENTVGSTTRDMAEAVSRSGAAFRVVGGTFDELNALAVTAMKATGQSGEQIGTMLKSLSARYADVSKKQGAYNVLLKEAKISMKSTTGELKPITQTLGELSTKWDTLSKTQQANIAKAMAGQYHYSRFLSIMENWDGVLNTVTASLDSTNSALKENENFMNSIQKQIDVTNASFEQLSVTIQKNYGQSVVNGIKLLNTFIQGLSTQQAQIAILTTVLGTATLAMLVFGKAAATAALAFAATPIGLFVTALGLLTAGLAYYIKKQGEASVKIAESNQVTIQASDAIVAYEDKIQSLGNSLNVYASRYVYLKKEGKDTSKIIGDITKIIAGSEKPLTDSQKAMLDLALTTQDAGIRTKEFGRFVNSLKADNYINEINKIDTHLLSLFETYDMISTKATFFERILARIALKAQGKSDYEIDKIGTEINYEKVAEKGKMDAAIKRAQLAKAKIKKAMETPITITPQNFGTEDTDPYGGDKGKKGKSNLSDELNMRLNLLERVTEETDLYNKKLEELAKKEAILRITLAQSNKTYKESSQEKNIDLQRITLTVEKYNKLNNSIANVSAQKKKFLKENEKIIYSITKNRVSNQKLTEQQKKDLEVELESLKTKANNIETMTTERKALEAKAIVVKGIIEQNKIYEKTLEDQRKEIISTRESIVQLTEAYLNMADVADGTGQIVRDALKSGIKTALLSGFDSTAMLQGFNSAADSIKEKMADSISEGIIYGAYGGKDEFNRQVDQMANEVTKFFTGKSEKDAKGKELAKAVEQFKPIIEPVDNLTNSNVELKKSVDNLESTISKKSPKQDGGNKITGSARGNQLGQQYFNKYIKNKGSSGGFGVNISSFMPKGIDLSSMLPKEMSSMFSQVQSLFNQGMAAASQGGLAGAFTNQIAQQFGIYGDIGEGKKTAEASNIGGTVGGAIGSFIPIPGASMIGGAIGSLIGGIFGSDEDRKQQRRIKQAQDSISEYNRLLNVQSNTVDETHEKIAKLTDIVDKLKEAGQDASQYTDEIARLSSPEQTFKDRIETLQHDVNMTRDKNVANKKYLDGLIQLQKNFGNQLTLQSKRWLEETVFQLQQDVQITATVRSDDDLERLTKDVVKKISVTESLRGQSFVFI
jgi:TP901 family phage tail tape measure protein